MAKLSGILKETSGVPKEYKEHFKKCIFCGREIEKGGGWQCNDLEIGVCEKDAYFLLDLYIDTMTDTGTFLNMNLEQKKECIFHETEKRIEKKEKIDSRNIARKAFTALGMYYYRACTPIDFWALSMTKEELVAKLKQEVTEWEMVKSEEKSQYVDICENQIIKIVEKESGEQPHTIKYFALPDVDYCGFSVGCAAKIENNGITYIFIRSRELLETIESSSFGKTKRIEDAL